MAGPQAREPKGGVRRVALSGLLRPATAKVVLILILLVWPLVYKSLYAMSIMTTAGLYALLTLAVAVILGQAGQLSFGHSAFYGIGAYVAGLLTIKAGIPSLLAVVLGAVASGLVALIVGRPVLKLRYFYLALATIGLGQIFLVLVTQLRHLTGGLNGFAGVPALSLFGFSVDSFLRQYYVVWIVVVVVLLLLERALTYRYGRSLRALATSEIASSSLGIRTANWKLSAFVVSAVICGIAGGLFAFVTGAVSPSAFTFTAAILPLVMGLIGGSGTIWGGIVGAILMTWVINGFTSVQQYSGLAYAVILIMLLLFLPMGILGFRPKSRAWMSSLLRLAPAAAPGQAMAGSCDAELPPSEFRCPPSPAAVCTHDAGLQAVARGGEPLLRLEDVSVAFGGLKAVNKVSLTVREGTITALIGPNGAGKTTLFNAISRQQQVTEGRIYFGDAELTRLQPADAARQGLARTFQNLRIFINMSVLENVLVGCHRHERSGIWSSALGLPSQRREERASRARALEVLRLLGLEDQAGKPAVSLPYGQQRLVEIARAMASEPRLLLLDEPAAGMNANERADLVRKICLIRDSGVTVLIVEHDISLVMGMSDEVNVLDYGVLIASGSPEAVKTNKDVIRAYLGAGRDEERCYRAEGSESCEESAELLSLQGVSTSYGSIRAVSDVSLFVREGEVMAVLGANGAGKTTLLLTISGMLRPTAGSITYRDGEITGSAAEHIVTRGLCQVPEGRQLFPTLSVEDNLLMGASGRREWKTGFSDDLAYIYDLFPILKERRRQSARTLSGGEQQMLAIGRALTGRPKLLLLDEPSMGLAPLAVERIFEALARLNQEGLAMLMVEQNAEMALSLAHRVTVMRTGCVVLAGQAGELKADDRLHAAYLGERQS